MEKTIKILLVDGGAQGQQGIRDLLSEMDQGEFRIEPVCSYVDVLNSFAGNAHDVCIIDGLGGNGLKLLRNARQVGCTMPLIVVTSRNASEALEALRGGALDCLIRDELSRPALECSIYYALERAHAFEVQNEYRRRYLALIENADEIIYTHDLEGNYTSANRAGELLTGYSSEEITKLNALDMVAPEYRDALCQMIRRTVVERNKISYELEIMTRDGRSLPLRVSSHLICHDGKPVGIQSIARDLTSRRKLEATLQETEQRYRELFENADNMVYTLDLFGHFTSLNATGERITGYSRKEAVKMNISQLVAGECLRQVFAQLTKKGKELLAVYQVDIITKDGRRVPLEVSTSPILREGKPTGIQAIGRELVSARPTEPVLEESDEAVVLFL